MKIPTTTSTTACQLDLLVEKVHVINQQLTGCVSLKSFVVDLKKMKEILITVVSSYLQLALKIYKVYLIFHLKSMSACKQTSYLDLGLPAHTSTPNQ